MKTFLDESVFYPLSDSECPEEVERTVKMRFRHRQNRVHVAADSQRRTPKVVTILTMVQVEATTRSRVSAKMEKTFAHHVAGS